MVGEVICWEDALGGGIGGPSYWSEAAGRWRLPAWEMGNVGVS